MTTSANSLPAIAANFLCAVVALAACGGSSATAPNGVGDATISGTFQGASFDAKDAISYTGDANTVAIVDFAGLCSFGLADAKAGAKYLYLTFTSGTFPLGASNEGTAVEAQVDINDADCNSIAMPAEYGTR